MPNFTLTPDEASITLVEIVMMYKTYLEMHKTVLRIRFLSKAIFISTVLKSKIMYDIYDTLIEQTKETEGTTEKEK